jgi:hypothetical protein
MQVQMCELTPRVLQHGLAAFGFMVFQLTSSQTVTLWERTVSARLGAALHEHSLSPSVGRPDPEGESELGNLFTMLYSSLSAPVVEMKWLPLSEY